MSASGLVMRALREPAVALPPLALCRYTLPEEFHFE